MERNLSNKERSRRGSDTERGRKPVFFITGVSVFMFVLGVLVGRGTSPVTFDIPNMEAHILGLFSEENGASEQDVPELAFFEALKQAEVEKIDIPSLKTQRFPGEKTPLSQASFAKKDRGLPIEVSRGAEARPLPATPPSTWKRQKKAVSAPSQEVRSAAPPPLNIPTIVAGDYTIQVAAMKAPGDAALLVRRLRGLGYGAYTVMGANIGGGGIWYRVRVGRFKSKKAAEPVLVKLRSENFQGYTVRAK